MTKNIKTVLAVFVFGVGIVALLVFYSDYKTPVVNIAPNSLSGCYVSHLKQDVYTLILKSTDEKTVTGKISFNNFEKDSSSGSFNGTFDNNILLGNYSFDSEGMHSNRQLIFKKVDAGFVEGFGEVKSLGDSEVFTDLNKITYEPNLTFVKSDTCTEQYIDSTNIFNFNYNPFFKVIQGKSSQSLDWRQNATKKGSILASVIIPRTYMPSTNFSDARLIIGRSTDASEIKTCATNTANGEVKNGDTKISGYPFTQFSFTGAGAGNFYDTTSYRGIFDGDCYVIEYTIHSTNIGNYSPEQGIVEFDKKQIVEDLESTIKSLKFNISSD